MRSLSTRSMSAPRLSLRAGFHRGLLGRVAARVLAAWVCLAPVSALAAPAATSEGPSSSKVEGASVAVLPVRFEDALAEGDERELEEVISVAFEHPELELVEGAKVERAHVDSCEGAPDEACMRAIGVELGVSHVVEVVVHARERDFNIVFRALSMSGSRSVSEVEVECLVCGVSEVRDRVAAQAALLRDRLLIVSEPGSVIIEGGPAGAKVSVDGRRVGELPFEGELSSGEHDLLVSARGYYDEFVPVTIVPGTVERVEVELVPEAAGERQWQRPFSWAMVGVGGAGIAVGTTLLALDKRDHLSRCDNPANIDANGDCKWIYETLRGGVGALCVGVAALSIGATLLVVNRRVAKPKPKVSAREQARRDSLRVGLGLGHLELSGRF